MGQIIEVTIASPFRMVSRCTAEDYAALVRQLDPRKGADALAANDGGAMLGKGPSFSCWVGDHIVAAGGCGIPWPGLGMAWAVLSDTGRRHPVFVHRSMLRFLSVVARVNRLRRVEWMVLASWEAGREWARRLGFIEDGLMPKYGPEGETCARYVWYPGELNVVPFPTSSRRRKLAQAAYAESRLSLRPAPSGIA